MFSDAFYVFLTFPNVLLLFFMFFNIHHSVFYVFLYLWTILYLKHGLPMIFNISHKYFQSLINNSHPTLSITMGSKKSHDISQFT